MLLSADIDRDALCRALVDGMADAVLVLDPGPGRFILANEAASLLLGYSVEQLCTMQPAELSNAWDVARLSEIGQGEVTGC
jgi:PAS domain-containing protein